MMVCPIMGTYLLSLNNYVMYYSAEERKLYFMKIFTLGSKHKKKEVLHLEYPLRMFDGNPLSNQWTPPRISRFNVGKMFFDLMTCDTSSLFIVNENAHKSLQPIMDADVEFLPTSADNDLSDSYYVFNVTKVLHCALDQNNSDIAYFSTGRIMDVYKYVFNNDAIKLLITEDILVFKIDDLDCSPIFFTPKFIDVVNQLNLTRSFDFKEIAEI